MGIDLTDGTKAKFTVKPKNRKLGDAPVDGPINAVNSNPIATDLFFDPSTNTGTVTYLDGGAWKVDFVADADLSSGVRNITSSIEGTNAPLEAQTLEVEVGPIEPA